MAVLRCSQVLYLHWHWLMSIQSRNVSLKGSLKILQKYKNADEAEWNTFETCTQINTQLIHDLCPFYFNHIKMSSRNLARFVSFLFFNFWFEGTGNSHRELIHSESGSRNNESAPAQPHVCTSSASGSALLCGEKGLRARCCQPFLVCNALNSRTGACALKIGSMPKGKC